MSTEDSKDGPTDSKDKVSEFERQADKKQAGMLAEFVHFLRHNKKWWLTPIIIAILLLGLIVVLGGSSIAPFIYTLF